MTFIKVNHTLPPARRLFNTQDVQISYLGPMNVICPSCKALHWIGERLSRSSRQIPKFGDCCYSGKIDLPPLHNLPHELSQLYNDQDPVAKAFRKNIRKYNNALAMTSVGQSPGVRLGVDHSINDGRGPWVYKVKGALHHIAGSLMPNPGVAPAFAQLYIFDPAEALVHRMQSAYSTGLDRTTLSILQDVLYRHHPSVSKFRQAFELLRDIPEDCSFQIGLRFDRNCDRRRYNLPTSGSTEIAVIIPGDGDQELHPRDIVLYRKGGGLKLINEMNPAYHPLHFVLLFPTGQLGWHPKLTYRSVDAGEADEEGDDGAENVVAPGQEPEQPATGTHIVRRGKRSTISQAEYFRYRLFLKQGEPDHIFRAGPLFQEFIVDMWAATEQSRLSFLANNQQKIRADVYQGLVDSVANGDNDSSELGQRIILPSSFTGSTRNMIQYCQDSLAINRHFHGADLFITITMDPTCREVQDALLPHQTPSDRPDLICRVFYAKYNELIDDLTKNNVLGKVDAYVNANEFQKRSLPHAHILVTLHPDSKLRTPEDVDSLISAEFPDEDEQSELHASVMKYMVHGPCGDLNPNSPCMENGKCTKGYPKPFREFTTISDDSYAVNRRRNTGKTFKVRGHDVDNRWVVPHCPHILFKYKCHSNVECVISIKCNKYMHKYLYKGHDRTTMEFGTCRDEVKLYLDARWVGACEAFWRISMFDMHREVPNVVRLQIHLPGQQFITWNAEAHPDAEEIVERAAQKDTTLTAYFKANAQYEEARQLLYHEFPQRFTWVAAKKIWKPRQRGFAIGRMYYVNPTAGERFYLRTLLTVVKVLDFLICLSFSQCADLTVKGATSFQDLCTFQGIIQPTFRDACLARGLLANDNEWIQCLQDASAMQTGKQLRALFVIILRDCMPSQPAELWLQFRQHICDDLKYALRQLGKEDAAEEEVYDYGLYLINQTLQHNNKSLRDYPPMPLSHMDWQQVVGNRLIVEQRQYDRQEQQRLADQRIPMLNEDQRKAFDTVMDAVNTGTGQCFFLNGPGGTGKTFVYNILCHALRAQGHIVICVASSGIASLLLIGGRTSHFRFKVPIQIHESSTCSIKKNSLEAGLLQAANLVIWDEVPMQHRHIIEAVERTLRDVRNSDKLFGGLSIVFGGDFQQTLPVIVKGSRPQIVGACLQRSPIWRELDMLNLKINMRLGQDPDERAFAQWQLDVGHGKHTDDEGNITLPDHFKCAENSLESLIQTIYPDIGDHSHHPDSYFSDRMLLTARNEDVHKINKDILQKFPGESRVFFSADSIGPGGDEQETILYPVEYLNSINASGLPLAELTLKVGCPVMILRNLNPSQGVCNGTRGILTRMSNRVLEVRLLSGDHAGEHVFIPRITVSPSDAQLPFEFRRHQYPVCLAFVLTINKSQGQSVKHVGLDFRTSVFTHGQFYVAISRVTSVHRIKAIWDSDLMEARTKNIVYTEVLLD
jgi:PIF1-like helicase/Helitron helicase-like domain at N-terminus